jgi:Na+-translocating ferredoxin:NAD+ oxidoreductase RnfC subunit
VQTVDICSELNIRPINDFEEFLNPDRVFIPVFDEKKLMINVPGKVLMGELVYKDNNIKYYSSISGFASNINFMANKKYLIIQNDFEENKISEHARNLDKIDKETFLKLLTNEELKKLFVQDIDTLYIDCIEDEPYFYNRYMYLYREMDDILSILHQVAKICNINNIKLVIKNNYQDLMKKYVVTTSEYNQIGMITVDNVYPIGNKTLLHQYLIHDNCNALIDLDDVLEMLYTLKKRIHQCEKYITISGNAIAKPKVFKIKKYSLLADVVKNMDIPATKVAYLKNNSLCGEEIKINETIIDDNFNGLIVNNDSNLMELECNRCGLCYDVCPAKINPLIKDERCLKCGLCNYVCPAHIKIVKEIQNK